jgi:preprotein translocase subunit SecG
MDMSNMLTGLLVVFFIVTCVALILVVLIQRPQGRWTQRRLRGGSGSGQTAFGAKVGDVLTYATITIFVVFLLTAIGLTYVIRPAEETQQTSTVESTETGETGELPEGLGEEPADATTDEPTEPGEPVETPPQTNRQASRTPILPMKVRENPRRTMRATPTAPVADPL